MNFTHHTNKLTIIALTTCLHTGFAHGMEPNNKAQKRVLQHMLGEDPDTITLNLDHDATMAFQETQELQGHLKTRKWCNAAYTLATLTMLGVDIANLYHEEEGLRTDNKLLYGTNAFMALCRAYATTHSLYELLYVQKSFNAAYASADEKLSCRIWRNAHCFATCAMGAATIVDAAVNGITHFPRMLAVWGLNTAYDAISTAHWQKNMDLCEKIMQQSKKLL